MGTNAGNFGAGRPGVLHVVCIGLQAAMLGQKPAGVEEMFDKWNAALQVSLL
jgi:hypothetical protein